MTTKEIFIQAFNQFKCNNRLTLTAYNMVLSALDELDSLHHAYNELEQTNLEINKENQELKQVNESLLIHNTEFSLGVQNILKERKKDSIELLNLSTRSYNALRRYGITYISELKDISYNELIRIRTLGIVHVNEILNKLNEFIENNV